MVPFLIGSLFWVDFSKETIFFLLAVTFLLLLGVLDDVKRLSWKIQLPAQFVAVLLALVGGTTILSINNPFNGDLFVGFPKIVFSIGSHVIPFRLVGDLIFVIWTVATITAVKWTAGTDGLMEGNISIATLVFYLISVREYYQKSAIMSALLVGSAVAFLFYNFYPSKIFSGSSGKSVYGFILAILAVWSGAKMAVAILVLALPLVDFIWVLVKRVRARLKDRSAFTLTGVLSIVSVGDNRHFHHELLRLGLSERQVAYVEYFVTATLGILALATAGALKAVVFISGIVFVGGIVIMATVWNRRRLKPKNELKKQMRRKVAS